jgi:AcrR family transcriptional regulator
MAPDAMADRRVRRTRTLLHTALIELIHERGYDRVTVQDILDRADVGRSTFYHHYQSKDELFLSGLHEVGAALRARVSTSPPDPDEKRSTSLMSPLWPLFEHADDNRGLSRALLGGRATGLALRAGRTMLRDVLTTHLRSRLAITDQDRLDLAVTFVINGLLGVLTWWLDAQPQRSAASVFADFEHLATQGISAYLPSQDDAP